MLSADERAELGKLLLKRYLNKLNNDERIKLESLLLKRFEKSNTDSDYTSSASK